MADHSIPRLVDTGTTRQLLVNGKPFLMLAGELQNSSFTSSNYMEEVWQNLVDANVNTVLGCVAWEVIEPVEDQFDFEELDRIVLAARAHDLRLVLLWFGSFKNGTSNYIPSWMKTDPKRFPRAKLSAPGGASKTADVLSTFYPEALEADVKAFGKLISHIKELDEPYSTVIMVQVENEPGLLGSSRDVSVLANERFSEPVPHDFVKFLNEEWDNLHQDLKARFPQVERISDNSDSANWETLFGKSPWTDELFMAYHYARYVNEVAAAGKAAYPLPLYTNVWLNSLGNDSDNDFPNVASGGGIPGDYPSGGATSGVLDIWQKFATNLDFIAPDIYLNDYNAICAKYRHRNQPLFIPEQRRDEYGARRIWVALGSYAALGVSPFGIDTVSITSNPFTKHYALLESLSKIILEAQRHQNASVGFFFDELRDDGSNMDHTIVHCLGPYEMTISRSFVFGKPGPGCGMVIHRGDGIYLLIGWGFQVSARALESSATFTGILRFEEKIVTDRNIGALKTGRVFNGDETRGGVSAMMPNEEPDYGGFPVAITIPARTMIAELEVYHLCEDG